MLVTDLLAEECRVASCSWSVSELHVHDSSSDVEILTPLRASKLIAYQKSVEVCAAFVSMVQSPKKCGASSVHFLFATVVPRLRKASKKLNTRSLSQSNPVPSKARIILRVSYRIIIWEMLLSLT